MHTPAALAGNVETYQIIENEFYLGGGSRPSCSLQRALLTRQPNLEFDTAMFQLLDGNYAMNQLHVRRTCTQKSNQSTGGSGR